MGKFITVAGKFATGPLAAFWAVERIIGLAGLPDDFRTLVNAVGMIPDWVGGSALAAFCIFSWQSEWAGRRRKEIASLFGMRFVHSSSVERIVTLTQEEYDGLESHDDKTLYLVAEKDREGNRDTRESPHRKLAYHDPERKIVRVGTKAGTMEIRLGEEQITIADILQTLHANDVTASLDVPN